MQETHNFVLKLCQIILERSNDAHVGHIGSALSIVDILAWLYSSGLNISDPNDTDRDRFILSKGHAALALYATLFLKGWISEFELKTFCTDGTRLGVHPEHRVQGIDFCTGSLGQGLTYGVGAALAARLQKSSRKVVVLISDAECNEGSLWEAVMFAAHHQLSNLVVILDLNGQQALGYTEKVLNLSPMSKRWEAFSWDVHIVDGHNTTELGNTYNDLNTLSGPPHVLIAKTIFGKRVSFMESLIKWHYWPMSGEEYAQALKDIGRTE